jgi:adenylosuccinate synthase
MSTSERRARVVVGAAFGDEGKGLVTDYYTQKKGYERHLVIRYNGGAQAGHTVVTPDGKRHVFGHFGSGTFNGARTFLSRYFIVNPLLFKKEYERLREKGVAVDKVFVDPSASVTCHLDMLLNMAMEDARGTKRHGSCGVGINETVRRCTNPAYTISVADLAHTEHLRRRIEVIRRDWLSHRLREQLLPATTLDSKMDMIQSEANTEQWLEAVQFFNEHTYWMQPEALIEDWKITFEGAQGLLLDQGNLGFHPHLTPSSTGLTNVFPLAKELGIKFLDISYVTRCYGTRHGAGPLPFELKKEELYKGIEDETNLPHGYQGNLRFAPLNIDLMRSAINTDRGELSGVRMTRELVVTCMDQIDKKTEPVQAVINGMIWRGSKADLIANLQYYVGIRPILTSFGPTRNDLNVYER